MPLDGFSKAIGSAGNGEVIARTEWNARVVFVDDDFDGGWYGDPAEARELARLLLAAADEAEGMPQPPATEGQQQRAAWDDWRARERARRTR